MTSLPHRDHDPVLTLYAHYFLAAELMRANYLRLGAKRKKRGKLSQNDAVDWTIYLTTWLGFLHVTCEGFKKIKMRLLLQNERPGDFRDLIPKSDAIGKAVKRHADPLRDVRNNVFHLRDDAAAVEKFFGDRARRLTWAEELHAAFAKFFSDYRVLCEGHYIMNDRTSESQLVPKRQAG
jgi:hypothetical protein